MTTGQLKKIGRMREKGYTFAAIGKAMGISTSGVCYLYHRYCEKTAVFRRPVRPIDWDKFSPGLMNVTEKINSRNGESG